MSVLLSYDELRDSINDRTAEIENRLDDVPPEELRDLMRDLLTERKLVIEEVDELRESRYGWTNRIHQRTNSMKLMISNLDEETYNLLQAKASRLGLEGGTFLNELMHQASFKSGDGGLPELSSKDIKHLMRDAGYIKVEHLTHMHVTSKDLEDLEHRIKFSHIKRVEFDKEIDVDLFNNKVKSINHCGTVVFPAGFSRLHAFAKAAYCREYIFQAD